MTHSVTKMAILAQLALFFVVASTSVASVSNHKIPITTDFLIQSKHPANLIYAARQDKTPFKAAKNYASHWLREFPKFGFEVEYARASQFKNIDGYEFELKDRTSEKHVFQKIAVIDGKALVFTLVEKSSDYPAQREKFKKWLSEISIQKIQ